HLAAKAAVPVAIHLDHGADLAMACACLKSGFTSIMYDGSSLPDEENIKNTRTVVLEASKYGVPVEGEIGQVLQYEDVSNGSEQDFLTDPDQAIRFVKETGVSSVAVAVGNIHHMKKKHARLNFDLIRTLRDKIDIPLVIHGCSGVSDEDLKKAVSLGINKVNVATEFNIAFTDALREFTTQYPTEFFPMDPMTAAMSKVNAIARERIHVLGAANKYE
ncbi:MAG: class II fructose-bisphosphate aldolase, partial [Fusicatenibacter sp.]